MFSGTSIGLSRIIERSKQEISDDISMVYYGSIGDSEIEKLFFCALVAVGRYVGANPMLCEYCKTDDILISKQNSGDFHKSLLVQPQAMVGGWRVDFRLFARSGDGTWKSLIVECDGHEFHERTKDQAARDRSRDRSTQMAGIPIFRFTGSELFRDAWKCAEQVRDWVRDAQS